MDMTFSSKKRSGQTHGSKKWRRVVSAALCAVLLGTGISGTVTAVDDSSAVVTNQEQIREDVLTPAGTVMEVDASSGKNEAVPDTSTGKNETAPDTSSGKIKTEADTSSGKSEAGADPSSGKIKTEADASSGKHETVPDTSSGKSEAETSASTKKNETGAGTSAGKNEAEHSTSAEESETGTDTSPAKSGTETDSSDAATGTEANSSDVTTGTAETDSSAEATGTETDPSDETTSSDKATGTETTPSDETDPEETSPESEEPGETEEQTAEETEAVYTLYLTHYFRFTVNGEGRNVKAEETLELTEADFEDGVCDLSRFAYDARQLTVTEAKPLPLEAFGESREGGARIVYAVADGWTMLPVDKAGNEGSVLRDVFQGQLSDYIFVPASVIRLQVEYKYSSTGGLAGIDAASPEIVEALFVKQNDDTYTFEFPLPTVEGFRIVLNPEPLNEYLVNKPTGNETQQQLHEMLQNGDFSVDIEKNTVYYYQEDSGETTHPKYNNRYSTKYNEAWNAALTEKDYTAMAISGDAPEQGVGDHGANALEHPELKVILTGDQLAALIEAQLQSPQATVLNLTVNYRRNATWYTVYHWVPTGLSGLSEDALAEKAQKNEIKTADGVSYVLLDTERMQGRVGGLTRASAKIGGVYDLLVPLGFSQQLIKNESGTGTGTTVDIYYKAADSYRVIFNTDNTYIPRQQVKLGEAVNFDFMETSTPTRKGYQFDGWQYLKKDAVPDENGAYDSSAYIPVSKEGGHYQLTISEQVITHDAKLQEMDGVPVLYLYPIWKPDTTQVTVLFWTEDLTGVDDVQAMVSGGVSDYYTQKYSGYSASPVTHAPVPESNNANYSNMGSFTIEVPTDSSLVENGSAALTSEIQARVAQNFCTVMGTAGSTPVSRFYAQDSFEILHETGNVMDYSTTTANADGRTMIYVYFTRNIYTLKFHYYGTATVDNQESPYCVAINTNGFSYAGADEVIENGELKFYYTKTPSSGKCNVYLRPTNLDSADQMPVPQTITITAKYGADLRDVWPAARLEEHVATNGGDAKMVSWATTQGKYRDDAVTPNTSHTDEPTIMGLYTTMDVEVIADPADPRTVHHLPAYWYNQAISYYRYNHCYEVPGLDIHAADVQIVSLYNSSTALKDTLYLVPVDTEKITRFGFTDLMEVAYDSGSGTVTYDVKGGGYYAVRGYTSGGETKYYAVARRVTAPSSNWIRAQNPSARQHMTRANDNADHTSRHEDTDGRTWGGSEVKEKVVGSTDAPYDLYFYYNRDRYRITYMTSGTNHDIHELGHIDLPYGTHVTEDDYAFHLLYTDTNQAQDGDTPKYLWTYPTGDAVPVCPDRNPNGTAVWRFKGWGLGPAGVNMQWMMPDAYTPQGQAANDFYIDSNLDLYAIWEAPILKVTFHLNGGHVSSGEHTEVPVPSNTVYTAVGTIPRPVRGGYTLAGWFLSDEHGQTVDQNGQPTHVLGEMIPFSFDSVIIEDTHVAAVWTANTTETYSYNVCYVTQALSDADKDKTFQTVQINDAGEIVDDGGTSYYVLERDEWTDQVYIPNLVLNLTAKLWPGYVPEQTNKTVEVTESGKTYNVVFFYTPQTTGSYTVKFVEAGTETEADPAVVHALRVNADQIVITPGAAAVEELTGMGYELVNRNADGGTYTAVTAYQDLTWLDQGGNIQNMDTLAGDNIPDTITYLVQPIVYPITYENADSSPASAKTALDAALAEVTAAADTPVEHTPSGKNPTQYTVKDHFSAVNPGPVWVNGKLYRFSYWSLGVGTTAAPNTGTGSYPTLEVSAGTIGALAFVANWEEASGYLTVTKTVAGDLGNREKEFTFTVTLDDASLRGIYGYPADTNGFSGTYGDMEFKDGTATFTLKHGQTKTASGLPAGIPYTVTEAADTNYTPTSSGDTGTIQAGEIAEAAFTNTRKEAVPTGIRDGMEIRKLMVMLMLALFGSGVYLVCSARARRKRGR